MTDALGAARVDALTIAEAIAPTWVRHRAEVERFAAPLREWMLGRLQPRPGETVLELAAGVGDTGFEAASTLGETGHLVCSDLSPTMIDAARRRGVDLGIGNAEYRVIDAQHIDLGSDSVDGVLCRLGFMLMDDPLLAFREARRVLRPAGRLVFAVWGAPERNPFFTIITGALVQHGHLPPPAAAPAPGVFALASIERSTALLTAAGFDTVSCEELVSEFVLPDPDAYLTMIADTAGPMALILRGLDESDRNAVRSDVAESLARFTVHGELRIPCQALGVAAS